jgi:hypothetical protein
MLEGLELPNRSKPCVVARKMQELSKEDQEILAAALVNPRWSTHALRRELNQRGFIIGDNGLRTHRNKECTCVRES